VANPLDVKPISPDGNDFYPLPADYHSLTDEGQRLARVNACRQWLLPGPPSQLADTLVASTWFFDLYYLQPDAEAEWDPLFYEGVVVPTPELHWDISRQWAVNRLNVTVAPRGCAKSTHCRRDMLMRIISSPYSFVYGTSTHDNTRHTGQILKTQCYENTRINQDFAPSYNIDKFKPGRGARPTGVDYFHLMNGSWVRCVSAESRLRGLRPDRFRLDDPEYDEKASTSMQTIRDYTEKLIFKIALPMVMRAKSGIDWTGTFVSKKHLLWHAMETMETENGLRAIDPRFDHWSRLIIRACVEGDDGRLVSCWPQMWPATREEKERLGLPGTVSLEEMREMVGTAAFNGEMQGRPGDAEEQYFKLTTDAKGRHAWWYEQPDAYVNENPLLSNSFFCWKDPTGAVKKVLLPEFLSSARLFMTVDTAYTEKATSDRRCCTVMALTRENELFVLDIWSDRKGDDVLLRRAFDMAALWRVPTIFVEVVKDSFKLYQRFRSAVATRMTDTMGIAHTPMIRDIRPGTMTKVAKIAAMDLRFEHNLIKFPLWKRLEGGGWSRLYEQIEGFNPEMDDGGLAKDDELDTVAMSLFVVKSKPRKAPGEPLETEDLDPIEELRAGRTQLPGGCSIVSGLSLDQIPTDVLNALLRAQKTESPSGTKV
jgi:hypothetical protein